MTMANDRERMRRKANKSYIMQPAGTFKANFQDAKWDRMTGFWQLGGYF